MTNKVSIIGLGWLGVPLAHHLKSLQFSVAGSSRDGEKIAQLNQHQVNAVSFGLPLNMKELSSDVASALFDVDTLVIAITPGFKRGAKDYAENIQSLVKLAEEHKVSTIVLLSSTGIYTGLTGELDESSVPDTSVEKVKLLSQAEQAVIDFSGRSIVLRLAGLIGPNRYPGSFLAGKKGLLHANAQVNLIHLDDVIGIISQCIESESVSGVFNCLSSKACTKQAFYQRAANQLGLEPPQFAGDDDDHGKTISGNRLNQQLAYQFKHPDLYHWLLDGMHESQDKGSNV